MKFSSRASAAVAVSSVFTVLAGCSTLDDLAEKTKIDYKTAGKRPALEVPPDLTAPGRVDRGPSAGSGTSATASAQQARAAQGTPTAGIADVLPSIPGVRFERSGSQRWLSIDMKPEQLWPILTDFWNESGFTLVVQSPQTGVMETDWAENRAKLPRDAIRDVLGRVLSSVYSTGERDKFRVRIERSAGGSELYLSHRGMIEQLQGQQKETSMWTARPSDPDLEAEFLRRIALRLGTDNSKAQAIATAARDAANTSQNPVAAPATSRVQLTGAGAGMALEVANESFDRAWRRVGLALDRVGFTVEDRNRADGVYFVRYADPEAEARMKSDQGFLDKLFKRDADIKPKTFRVNVQAQGSNSKVFITDNKGAAPTDSADIKIINRILGLLRSELN